MERWRLVLVVLVAPLVRQVADLHAALAAVVFRFVVAFLLGSFELYALLVVDAFLVVRLIVLEQPRWQRQLAYARSGASVVSFLLLVVVAFLARWRVVEQR